MRLADIVARSPRPGPWEEGDNIPWHEPGFSRRMLAEHLSQEHDAASRRADVIDRHVAWIHGTLLGAVPTRILDLCCGPGLYASRLAALGHTCDGIDYSPASIEYAREHAAVKGLACSYTLGDVRTVEPGDGYGAALVLYGELNVFPPEDARALLRAAWRALGPGGILVLEPHTFEAVRRLGEAAPTWRSATSGLFSDRPHLLLEDHHWSEQTAASTTRYYVVDARTGEVTRYASSMQAYTDKEYAAAVIDAGFEAVRTCASLAGEAGPVHPGLFALVARRPVL